MVGPGRKANPNRCQCARAAPEGQAMKPSTKKNGELSAPLPAELLCCHAISAGGSRGTRRCLRRAVYYLPELSQRYPLLFGRGYLCGHHTPRRFRKQEYRINP
jgi:hypothetical protein